MRADVLIIGAGASGMMAGIASGRAGKRVAILERMKIPGMKVLASGGERCNFTNTLPENEFMERFGRHGRFMEPALQRMGQV